MANNEDLYPTAAALGRLDKVRSPKPQKLDCVHFRFRDGTELFYPYRFISSVFLGPEYQIIINCACGHFASIILHGHNLRPVAQMLAHSTLEEIQEADHPEYCAGDNPVVTDVDLYEAESRSSNAEKNNM